MTSDVLSKKYHILYKKVFKTLTIFNLFLNCTTFKFTIKSLK